MGHLFDMLGGHCEKRIWVKHDLTIVNSFFTSVTLFIRCAVGE